MAMISPIVTHANDQDESYTSSWMMMTASHIRDDDGEALPTADE